jgi:CRISPR/Cas system-associated exonuclease Cas4 (RecB family)
VDIDKKIEEKKKKLLKTMVGEKKKVKAEKTKKIKFGTVIPEVVDRMIEAIAMAENKQKSQVVEEAIREYFKSKWKEYDETTKNFLIAKFGRDIVEVS